MDNPGLNIHTALWIKISQCQKGSWFVIMINMELLNIGNSVFVLFFYSSIYKIFHQDQVKFRISGNRCYSFPYAVMFRMYFRGKMVLSQAICSVIYRHDLNHYKTFFLS